MTARRLTGSNEQHLEERQSAAVTVWQRAMDAIGFEIEARLNLSLSSKWLSTKQAGRVNGSPCFSL